MSCMTPLKFILVIINVIFWAAGAVLIYGGVVYLTADDGSASLVRSWPAVTVLCAACLLIVGGIIGCVGTLSERKPCLAVFLVFLALVLINMAVVAGILIASRGNSTNTFDKFVMEQYKNYGNDSHPANITSDQFNGTLFVDTIQDKLDCCGYTNYTDWFDSAWFHSNVTTVPLSCCRPRSEISNSTCTGKTDPEHIHLIYTQGCKDPLNKAFDKFYNFLAWGSLSLAILIFIGSLVVLGLLFRQRNLPLGYSELSPGYTEA